MEEPARRMVSLSFRRGAGSVLVPGQASLSRSEPIIACRVLGGSPSMCHRAPSTKRGAPSCVPVARKPGGSIGGRSPACGGSRGIKFYIAGTSHWQSRLETVPAFPTPQHHEILTAAHRFSFPLPTVQSQLSSTSILPRSTWATVHELIEKQNWALLKEKVSCVVHGVLRRVWKLWRHDYCPARSRSISPPSPITSDPS